MDAQKVLLQYKLAEVHIRAIGELAEFITDNFDDLEHYGLLDISSEQLAILRVLTEDAINGRTSVPESPDPNVPAGDLCSN